MGVVHGAPVFLDAAERLWAEGAEFGLAFLGYGVDRAAIEARAARSGGRCAVIDPQPPAVAASAFRGAVEVNDPAQLLADMRAAFGGSAHEQGESSL